MRTTSKHPRYIVGKLVVLTLFGLSQLLVSGCGNQARTETTKNDYRTTDDDLEALTKDLKDYFDYADQNSNREDREKYLVAKGSDRIAKWKNAAEKGISEGQILFGLCHRFGVGVPRDDAEGINWYRKAAEQGNVIAQYNLAGCYNDGIGVSKNITEAINWWRKAAEQGHVASQYNIGMCYFNGWGVPEDKKEALNWYRKAAELGFAMAQLQIGIHYFNGEGVARNRVEAAKWISKAAEQGHTRAIEVMQSMRTLGQWEGDDSPPVVAARNDTLDNASEVASAPSSETIATTSPPIASDTETTDATFIELKGHTDGVFSAAFSPDGKRIVTGSSDKTARIWDAETGKVLRTFEGHNGAVHTAAFVPDEEEIITLSVDGTGRCTRILDAETGEESLKVEIHVTWSPDKQRFGVLEGNTARLGATGKEGLLELEGHTDNIVRAIFSPDGKKVVTGSSDKTARIWDAETGKELQKLEGHLGFVWSAAFSPDGKKVVTASWLDNTARIWDAETGKVLQKLEGPTGSVTSAAFSPDGKKVVTAHASSSDNTARIWDAETGKELKKLEGHTAAVTSAAFSPDGKKVVTGSSDSTARIWNTGQQDAGNVTTTPPTTIASNTATETQAPKQTPRALAAALHLAIDEPNQIDFNRVQSLLADGADVNAKAAGTGCTPLHVAAMWGDIRLARLLVSHGANVNARCDKGGTPLDYAGMSALHRMGKNPEEVARYLSGEGGRNGSMSVR
jgi:WD40 repeat protein